MVARYRSVDFLYYKLRKARMSGKKQFFILTGDPGVGKTTLIKKLVSSLSSQGVKTSGFFTEEVRSNGVREGFDVVRLDGTRGSLARDNNLLTSPTKFKVGKYGVLVEAFEAIALPCLENTQNNILVIDEIGKMEFFSTPFKSKIRDIFSQTSNKVVLATIPVRKSDPIIETIRNASNAKVWTVTRENRNNIDEHIITEMKMALQNI